MDTPDGPMPCHRWLPPGGAGPGLVLFQEIFGVSNYIKKRSADLAALGYVVLAPEIYWRLGKYDFDVVGLEVINEAMGFAGRVDWDLAVADGQAAFQGLRSQDEVTGGVGLIGFCFGGGLAFNVAALEEPDVLVSYYGSALGRLLGLADRVTAPSLHHFGLADSYIDLDTIWAVKAAVESGPDGRFETHEGADHAFDNPMPMLHHPAASKAAWATTTAFLAEHLPPTTRQ